jgi:hypothetical protein
MEGGRLMGRGGVLWISEWFVDDKLEGVWICVLGLSLYNQ